MGRVEQVPVINDEQVDQVVAMGSLAIDQIYDGPDLALPKRQPGEGDLWWQQYGVCTRTDPEAFFPKTGPSNPKVKAMCQGCEVKSFCLQYALDKRIEFGIWGGITAAERRALPKSIYKTT